MWILYAFGAAFFAGITAILAKIGIKKTDSTVATAIRTIVILVFAWLIVFIVGSFPSIRFVSRTSLLFLILSGFATGGSWLCYFKALQLSDVNKIAPIDKSSTLLTMLLAFIFFGEAITLLKLLCMCAIGGGTYLMITKKAAIKSSVSNKKWFVYAVFSAIFASLTSILGKVGIHDVESNLGTAIRTIVVLFMAWFMVFATKKQSNLKGIDKKSLLFICLSGLSTGASWLFYYKALQKGLASVVVPIDQLSIVISVGFSYFILKETMTKKSWFGLALLVCGTLLLLV